MGNVAAEIANESKCRKAICGLKLSLSFLLFMLLVLGEAAANPIPDAEQYVAVVDAGSTGSRIIVYRYDSPNETSNELRLLAGDFFHESKPGLSSYLDKPDEGVQSIEKLLKEARDFIPRHLLASTRLALRATAGMRLADKDKADLLIDKLRVLFANSEFKVDENAVQIIAGSDEGIFSWITVNYLKRSLSLSQTEQLAAMDLGGGSTQITFPLANTEEASYNKTDLRNLIVAERNISVFSNSYLGTGFEAASYTVLTKGNTTQETTLQSTCVHPDIVNASWTYQNVEYHVSGKQNEQNKTDIEACGKLIKEHVIPKISPKPVTLRQHQLAAWNKFFSVTFDLGKRGHFSVGSLHEEAKKECGKFNEKHPFKCFKLIYTWTLLTDGFGLPEESKVQYAKRISGHYVSWTLGFALNLVNYIKI